MQLTIQQIDQRIGTASRFIDVYIVLDRIVKKEKTDQIKAEHGSISAWLQSLFERYQVSELAVKVYAPNGTSPKEVDSFSVSLGKISDENETEEKPQETTQEKSNSPRPVMENTPNSFYALQNELIRNAYETLKKDYDILQQKFNKTDDELRVAKTNLAIADGMKEMAVLKGTVEASSSLGGVLKDALRPENADGIAKLVMAVKGIKPEGSSQPAFFAGLTQPQKDAVQAMADVIKGQPADETEAMLTIAIMASKDPAANYFRTVKGELDTNMALRN